MTLFEVAPWSTGHILAARSSAGISAGEQSKVFELAFYGAFGISAGNFITSMLMIGNCAYLVDTPSRRNQ
ncbi:hypothetical protein KTE62_26425 [Burkholderia multivorans]|uniref:hypothetical protein n=1 Tax=Burkholderia multivorans TaxID=87883 RepID=UPI001C21BD2E|nr:hypothetical protein [Burkholderia multivorans]MBU9445239.1 hypothetical protein [Burkholderia multivorans]